MEKDKNPPKIKIFQPNYVTNFICNSNNCLKNCCEAYTKIHADEATINFYKQNAPELLNYITEKDGEAIINREDGKCIHYKNGLCEIHRKYGIDYQIEICHTFPRSYFKIGEDIFISGLFTCSEMLKSALYSNNAYEINEANAERIPADIRDLNKKGFENYTHKEAIQLHKTVMNFANQDYNSEKTLLRLLLLSIELDNTEKTQWINKIDEIITDINNTDLDFIILNAKFANKPEILTSYIRSLMNVSSQQRTDFNTIIKSFIQCVDKEKIENLRTTWEEGIINSPLEAILKAYVTAKLSEIIFPINNNKSCFHNIMDLIINYVGIRLTFAINFNELNNSSAEAEIMRIINIFEFNFYNQYKITHEYYENLNWINFDKVSELLLNL